MIDIVGIPLLLSLFLPTGDKPAPKIPVGKETTYVTGPLDKEGYIDYEAALNDRLGKGITPAKNANALLWKALGSSFGGKEGMPAEFFQRLGIQEPPQRGDYFIGLDAYLKDHAKLKPGSFTEIYDQLGWATQRPWRALDYPHIAAWLKVNEKPLDLVVEACKLPDFFNPLVSPRTGKEPGALISVHFLPGVQKCRELASALPARALLRVAEGKVDEAWQDLLACHRLGRLIARGATLIEGLVGIAIDLIASEADLAYLERANLTPQQIRKCLKDLQSLPPMPSMAGKVDVAERILYLDSLQIIRRGRFKALQGLGLPKVEPRIVKALAAIDWEPALRNGNRWYDRMAAAMRLEDRTGREKELDNIEKELKTLKKKIEMPAGMLQILFGGKKEAGKAIGDILISLLVPATRKVQSAQDRAMQVQRNLYLAFALAAYHRENGRYPAKLAELSPKYLPSIPDDLFSGKALIYHPSKKGYLLYSVGINGKDEGGRWHGDDPPGDDPRVRMPLPEMKRKR